MVPQADPTAEPHGTRTVPVAGGAGTDATVVGTAPGAPGSDAAAPPVVAAGASEVEDAVDDGRAARADLPGAATHVSDEDVARVDLLPDRSAPEDRDATGTGDDADAQAILDGRALAEESVPDDADEDGGLRPVPGARFVELPLGAVRPNPRQPRQVFDVDALAELVGSIEEVGVLQPVVVREAEDGYELIMGERRWRAAQRAGLDTIPAIVRETDDADLLRDALLENLHRAELNPLEEAAAYQQLLDDFGCTHEVLAQRIHRSRPQISNTLRLLRLPATVQRRIAAGVLSAGHARALLGLTDGAAIERLAQRIVAEGLSVRAVEEIVALGVEDAVQRRGPRARAEDPSLDELAGRLSDRFETRVKVSLGRTRGRLTVEFASRDDLNRILASLAPDDPGLLGA
ncbi:ParB/RepB/Spo0J family partition protein [Cellulomonas endophytica]|uniref:ParB/RepB/Spo0J family partition protein n=1 Tax=Cellulomonas endophytica TaxID=2494735 RepID=UPI003B847949